MNKERTISEKEFELINILATGMPSNQRELAVHAGISLGMANLLLKRLVTKGYLRVRQLNRRKVEHLLTAKGFSEKARKSYHYTVKTLHSLSHLKVRIQNVVADLFNQGHRRFYVMGRSDLADLAEMAVRQLNLPEVTLERSLTYTQPDGAVVILWSDEEVPAPLASDQLLVNVLVEISKRHAPEAPLALTSPASTHSIVGALGR